MCKCKEMFDFEHVKKLAIQYANFNHQEISVYKSENGAYNYSPTGFCIINKRDIIFTYNPENE